MRRLLLDTHVWLWYVTGSGDLPRSLREAIEEAVGLCWLSPISVWEVGMLIGKRRIRTPRDAAQWIDEAMAAYPLREAPVNFEVARTVPALKLPHGDPADHFLAATALVYDLTLVTLDRNLISARAVEILTA